MSRIYFTNSNGPLNNLKKTKVVIMVLVGNQRGTLILNLSHYMLLSSIAKKKKKKKNEYRSEIKFDKDISAVKQNYQCLHYL